MCHLSLVIEEDINCLLLLAISVEKTAFTGSIFCCALPTIACSSAVHHDIHLYLNSIPHPALVHISSSSLQL